MGALPIAVSATREMGGLEGQWSSSGGTGAEPRLRLLSEFQALHTGPPEWAWPYAPSIPFIGTAFAVGSGLLVYASAENLAWMHGTAIPERFTSARAWDRYRAVYEDEGRNSGDFFPIMGMAPVEKGGLLAAALFIAGKLGLPTADTPRAFLETLSVTDSMAPDCGHSHCLPPSGVGRHTVAGPRVAGSAPLQGSTPWPPWAPVHTTDAALL